MSLGMLIVATALAATPPDTDTDNPTGTTGETGTFTGGSGATGDTGPGGSGGSGTTTPVDTAPPDTGNNVPHTGTCGCASTGPSLGWLAIPALLVLRRRR